ncbi:MAG: shikimate kinase [Lachnospiraceae bacterium]
MNNIVLIGFMGSGKTTLGQWMSRIVNMNFVDTDDYIEKKSGRKINDIFAGQGEECFRDMETEALKELGGKRETVISVGGGLPVRECNRKLMRELGVVVYLRASRETLIERLQGDTTRPLLAGDNLSHKIDMLMAARKDIYLEAADIIIDTDGKSVEEIYNELEDKLVEYIQKGN